MKKKVEILSLHPSIDTKTLRPKDGLTMYYKTDNGLFEYCDLEGSQKSVLDLLGIEDFNDAVGKKIYVNAGSDPDSKPRIYSVHEESERPQAYADLARVTALMEEMVVLLKKEREPVTDPPTEAPETVPTVEAVTATEEAVWTDDTAPAAETESQP